MSRRVPYASLQSSSLQSYVEESELGTAASKDVITDVVASDDLVTSSGIYNALLDYVKWSSIEIGNTLADSVSFVPSSRTVRVYVSDAISALNLGAPQVFQGAESGISITWNDPGEYLYTFANGLPSNAICSVSFERTFSYDSVNGDASKVSYRLIGNNQISVILQNSAYPYTRVNGRTSLIVFDSKIRPVYSVFSGWSGILISRTRTVYAD